MKILIVTPGKLPVPATRGGAVENLIQMLINSNDFVINYDVEVIGVKDKTSDLTKKGYKNVCFHDIVCDGFLYKFFRALRYIVNRLPKVYIGNEYICRVKKYLKKYNKKYDIIIIQNSPEYGLILRHDFSKENILHLHNDFLNKEKLLAKEIIKQYEKVFCLSDFVKNKVKSIDGCDSIVTTVYNGIDVSKFKKISDEEIVQLKTKYNIPNDHFVYIYTGRITPEKGVLELIKSFNKIVKEYGKSSLIICGELKENNYCNKIRKASKQNSNIILTGYIDYDALNELYNIADIGVVPSIIEEGFGLVVVENMACGNPVIVSDSGGMMELVNENVGMIFKRNNNFVQNLYECMKKIRNISYDSNLIRQHSELYSKERYIKNFINNIEGE